MNIADLVDVLEPLERLRFDETPVRSWRVTWPDGKTEVIKGHFQQQDCAVVAFHWLFLGAHRHINTAHVRDIEEIAGSEYPQVNDLAAPPGDTTGRSTAKETT